ncbi:DNA polymerase III subunit gamma/tau [Steroidobacter denitrificans]|uniref:DNA polymerase III subunit gamma/tau n=1 Tax=Steroidobacter denitrificans TaxID=465721 RepID=A0A127FCE1_STEDE|nr:DNA polymerase III subunit gamma/tau [Steroidobacter denitrificans]AMN47238.1 DNA polymerase III subunit gamma/tau [Steroidobacter denitrificans]
MSYLALARKWRPRNFEELAGQEHVMRALVNALQTGRVHHAFLFTGTRGVGKTTIARILAKSLNCETGVTPTPCGQCSACREIDEGRFVDLIEVDAASRTKVDDTRELLDNVQYAPARGRYKVYLIDEVHMLSTHSFNALLKTLEEPPPHVKFLLATTDPQKLPVTVLSRCLQFSLKRFTPGMVFNRLTEIVQAENIEFEPEALRLVARAAQGSMRDALSLLDQVIAFCGGTLTAADTRKILGTLDRAQVFTLVDALVARDARRVLDCVSELDEQAPDYGEVLAELAALLQKLALLQAVPDLQLDEAEDQEIYRRLAAALSPEDAQLFYQFAILGRRDLELAPDTRAGFEMTLLRMLAFGVAGERATGEQTAGAASSRVSAATPAVRARGAAPAAGGTAMAAASGQPASANTHLTADPGRDADRGTAQGHGDPGGMGDWTRMIAAMNLRGPVTQLAAHCILTGRDGNTVKLLLDANGELFRTAALEEKLTQAMCDHLGEKVRLEFTVSTEAKNTPANRQRIAADDRLQAARASIQNDPNVQAMQDMFGASVNPESIGPAD